MVEFEQYADEMRQLGIDFDANAYERNMVELQDQLDAQVNQSIQKIFNQMSSDEIAGKMDSMEEVEALAEQYYNMLDTDIESLTRKQYDQMLVQQQRAAN